MGLSASLSARAFSFLHVPAETDASTRGERGKALAIRGDWLKTTCTAAGFPACDHARKVAEMQASGTLSSNCVGLFQQLKWLRK
jgi:hypothetical protein